MSNYVCPECGANYIDCGHNNPAVLAQDLEIARLKELLKECREFYQEMYSLNIINSCSLSLYDNLKKRINRALGEE